jgi:predicted metal-dependent HD superfamily phosphohydrolase
MHSSWLTLLQGWGIDRVEADRWFEEVAKAYAGSGRHYHTLDHAWAVVQTVDSLAAHTKHPKAVNLAAWLHDVVYDSTASDNEERSAAYAELLCVELSIPEGGRVATLIRATKTHDAAGDADAAVLIDADLAILGADEATYRIYADDIRREYAWVQEVEYQGGRQRILKEFLSRPRIFHYLSHLEEVARRNIAQEIDRLESAASRDCGCSAHP